MIVIGETPGPVETPAAVCGIHIAGTDLTRCARCGVELDSEGSARRQTGTSPDICWHESMPHAREVW